MKKIIITSLAFIMAIVVITGCEKNTTVIIKTEPVDLSDTVFFSADLIPLFTKNCATSGCHGNGAYAPVLVADKAYNSLIDGKYVNVAEPSESILYKQLTGALTPAMPMGASSNPSNINQLVLTWITQGAKNN